jgi:integrase/recombinase XerD
LAASTWDLRVSSIGHYEASRWRTSGTAYYVCEFYSFAQRQRWIEALPFGYETRRVIKSAGLLAHLDASGGRASVRDVMPPAHKDWPRFLSGEQSRTLLAAATNPHHRMIIRLGLGSGLRKEELATFPRAYVFDPDRAGVRERNVRVNLDPMSATCVRL